MDFLKEYFNEDALTYEAFSERLQSKGVKLADLAQGGYVGMEKFRAMQEQRDELRAAGKAMEEKLAIMQSESDTDLQKRIAQLESQLCEEQRMHGEELANRDYAQLLEQEIALRGGRSRKAICALLDEGEIRGAEDMAQTLGTELDRLCEAEPYLFGATAPPVLAEGTGAQTRLKDSFREMLGV